MPNSVEKKHLVFSLIAHYNTNNFLLLILMLVCIVDKMLDASSCCRLFASSSRILPYFTLMLCEK